MDLPDLEWSKSSEHGPEGVKGAEEPEQAPPDTADRHMAQMLAKLPQKVVPVSGVPGATNAISTVGLSSSEVDDAPRGGQGGDSTRLLPGPRRPQVSNALEGFFDAQRPAFQSGQSIGRYVALEELGAGAMGAVLKAYDAELDRVIALKLLHAEGDEYDTARFRREAQVLAKLSHPNVIQVHDVGEIDGQTFIAMELIKGQTLREWMEEPEQPRPWRKCVNVYLQAGAGLAAAHERGIVHRDFKPDNVMIDEEGRTRVLDFGLARQIRQTIEDGRPTHLVNNELALEASLTHTGTVMGTPPYMPSEQWRGEEANSYSDQFSFCVAIYEALYGVRPFFGRTPHELMVTIAEGRIQPLDAKGSVVPSRVRNVVLRGLSPDREQRWPSMDELLAELRRLVAPPGRRYVARALAMGLAAMAGSAGFVGYLEVKDRCTGALAQMEGIWDDDRRQAVAAAILGTELSYAPGTWTRVEQRLDDYAGAWTNTYTEICEATSVRGEQSTHLMDVRMACLERRRGEMRALVDVFLSPDEDVVREAVKAVQSLEASAGCTAELDDASFGMVAPQQRHKAEEIERLLARSGVMVGLGKLDGAVEGAARALESARELGHQPTLARAAIQHARLRADRTDDPEAARKELIEAVGLAAQTNQPDLEVLGWARLVVLEGVHRGHPDAGLAFQVPAEIALQQRPNQHLEATLLQAVGSVLAAADDHDGALTAHLRALELYKAVLGPQHSQVATMLSNIGAEYARLGRTEEAEHYLESAASMLETLYGSRHPRLASARFNLGSMLKQGGDAEAAHTQYLRAHQVFSAALPQGHPRTLKALVGLAQTERELDPARAEQRFEDVLAQLGSQKEPDWRLMVTAYNSLGSILREQALEGDARGDTAQGNEKRRKALQSLTSALQALEGQERVSPTTRTSVHGNLCLLGRDQSDWDSVLEHCGATWRLAVESGALDSDNTIPLLPVSLAQAYVALGKRELAISTLRDGLSKLPVELSMPVRIELAGLLWENRLTRSEAVELILQVQSRMLRMPLKSAQEAERWLAQHPIPVKH